MANVTINKRKFLCVDYPGYLSSEASINEIIENMGGVDNLKKTYQVTDHPLQLRLSATVDGSKSPFVKPVLLTCSPQSGVPTSLILKVTKRKSSAARNLSSPSDTSPPRTSKAAFDIECVGTVVTSYECKNLVDVQCLPVESKSTEQAAGVSGENPRPDDTETRCWQESFANKLLHADFDSNLLLPHQPDTPLYVPPVIFFRSCQPSAQVWHKPRLLAGLGGVTGAGQNSVPSTGAPEDQEGQLPEPSVYRKKGVLAPRKPRLTASQFVSHLDAKVPSAPSVLVLQRSLATLSKFHKKLLEILEMLYSRRPIWLSYGLQYNVSVELSKEGVYEYDEKIIFAVLPRLAYYFTTGPWSRTWVKLGFDPRKNPSAKIYQSVDYRLRDDVARKLDINVSRKSACNSIYKRLLCLPATHKTAAGGKNSNGIAAGAGGGAAAAAENRSVQHDLMTKMRACWKFTPNSIPYFKQMHFLFCDIELPEVQTLLHSNDRQTPSYSDIDGWCVRDVCSKCRSIMTSYITSSCSSNKDHSASVGQDSSLSSTPKRFDQGVVAIDNIHEEIATEDTTIDTTTDALMDLDDDLTDDDQFDSAAEENIDLAAAAIDLDPDHHELDDLPQLPFSLFSTSDKCIDDLFSIQQHKD